jgi:hypothetical protein
MTNDIVARWGHASSSTSPPPSAPWSVMPTPKLDAKPSPAVATLRTTAATSSGGAWIASVVVAVVGGLLGALVGVWLALG